MTKQAIVEQPETMPVAIDPMALLVRAVDKGADVDQLTKLMDLRDRWEANEARKAFHRSLTAFASKCPSMERKNTLKHGNTVISKYADLDEIKSTIQPYLAECDLNVTYRFEETKDELRTGCVVTHIDGHSEVTWRNGPIEAVSSAMNALQAGGSAQSYLMRYSVIGALGITSADADDDGAASGEPILHRFLNHQECVRNNFNSVFQIKESLATGDYETAAQAMQELDRETQLMLWLAPSRGGIFTTSERSQMKSDEWSAALKLYAEGIDETTN